MISTSPGHVSVISLDSFQPSYPARIRVNCLDESIAVGLEEGNSLFPFSGISFRDGMKLSQARSTHLHVLPYTSPCCCCVCKFKHTTQYQKCLVACSSCILPHTPKSRATTNATNMVVMLLPMVLNGATPIMIRTTVNGGVSALTLN